MLIGGSEAEAIGEEIIGWWHPTLEIIERHYSQGRHSGAYKCHSRKNHNVGSPPPLFCHDVKPSPSPTPVNPCVRMIASAAPLAASASSSSARSRRRASLRLRSSL